jgi:hypothetical protein
MQRFVAAVRLVIYRLRAQKRLQQIKAAAAGSWGCVVEGEQPARVIVSCP